MQCRETVTAVTVRVRVGHSGLSQQPFKLLLCPKAGNSPSVSSDLNIDTADGPICVGTRLDRTFIGVALSLTLTVKPARGRGGGPASQPPRLLRLQVAIIGISESRQGPVPDPDSGSDSDREIRLRQPENCGSEIRLGQFYRIRWTERCPGQGQVFDRILS
jgi:hypothetical protein